MKSIWIVGLAVVLSSACALDEVDSTGSEEQALTEPPDVCSLEVACLACATVDFGDGGDTDDYFGDGDGDGDGDWGEEDEPGGDDQSGDDEGSYGNAPSAFLAPGGGRGKGIFNLLHRFAKCAKTAGKLAKLSKEGLKKLFMRVIKLPGFKNYFDEALAVMKRCPKNFAESFEQIADLAARIKDLERMLKRAPIPDDVADMGKLIIELLNKKLSHFARCMRRAIGDSPHPDLRPWLNKLDEMGL